LIKNKKGFCLFLKIDDIKGDIMEIKVNKIILNYEQMGHGKPLILLHGNGESLNIFKRLAEKLKKNYTVYLIDSRNHGKSSQTKVFCYDTMASDIEAFIKQLKLEKPALLGFSDGGIVGMIMAINQPKLISKLILCGVNINPKGFNKPAYTAIKNYYKQTKSPYYKMMINEPNIKPRHLRKIKAPTLITVGANDVIEMKHTELILRNIKGSELYVFEDHDHSSYVINRDDLLPIVSHFLET
jgi:pimeloyl-ACP methyl ester carboxylesterase